MNRWKRVGLGFVSAVLTFAPFALAQSSTPNDESSHHHQLVTSPESLSGLWEAPDRHGGIVGLHLKLITSISGTTTSLAGAQQTWEHLEVGVFQTENSILQFGDQNYFSDSPQGVYVRFENDHLYLHLVNSTPQTPSVDLDLKRVGDIWKGRLHRGDFDARVELRRPAAHIDTWIADSPMARSCVHIPNSTAPEFNGWSDSIPTLGYARYANNIPRPATAAATYGDLVKIRHLDNNRISIEFNAYSGICCSRTFVGTATPDGMLLKGSWVSGPNQSPRAGSFKKAPPNSCLGSSRSPQF
jgi:hypothetical protein